MDNKLSRYSRAGDVFHYRWAARRCLQMINPKSPLKCVSVESSKELKSAGEYVIDLAEYLEDDAGDMTTMYFQLKHSTIRTGRRFTLSELEKTLAGFADLYRAASKKDKVAFSFVSNRPVSEKLKKGTEAIRAGSKVPRNLQKCLERITKLKGPSLKDFCKALSFKDDEDDYLIQKVNLQGEMAEYIAGFVDSNQVDSLIALIADRALPKSEDGRKNGEIYAEDILKRLGVTSKLELFPAPPAFEKLPIVIKREQHDSILGQLIATENPTIIHSTGGVGKSVVALQIANSLPPGSIGIVYDCFGAGKYRNTSEPRHRPRDGLVQMANELAARGLCLPLICPTGALPDSIFRAFLERIEQASQKLREVNKEALLFLFVDAADNAEMAANEINDKSFVRALLREQMPSACRLVALCRTERIHLLEPLSTVRSLTLKSFSKAETALHLRGRFSTATARDIEEFHRLTGGNPRVQANALNTKSDNVNEVLASLGPEGTTVDDQIASQLESAVSALKDRSTPDFKSHVDAICRGLANLPPFIPFEVLAKASNIDVPAIKSFISDLGRPLWHSDESVQFRDEPTESWFREKFAADKTQIIEYVSRLEPLAKDYAYVAKVLPQLLLKSENYERLVTLALSNDLLPENNPIDERDIRVYRLQFAFKAALKLRRIADAARLALRAGEEVAGDKRQLELLQANIDLIAPLQDAHRVEELAHRQLFRGGWAGSENLYSASLLSSVKDFHGEARSFLRAARKWLAIYFEERDRLKKNGIEQSHYPELLKDHHLAEFAWTHFNLDGAAEAVRFLVSWRPPQVVLSISGLFIQRLIDANLFDEIEKIAQIDSKNPYLILAVADRLSGVGRFPEKETLRDCLESLISQKTKVPTSRQGVFPDTTGATIVSFAEACAATGLPREKILKLLEMYTSTTASRLVTSDFQQDERRTFFRAAALRNVIAGNFEPDINTLIPQKKTSKENERSDDGDQRELSQIIESLLPWFMIRARLIARDPSINQVNLENVYSITKSALDRRYHSNGRIPFEISRVHFEVLAFKRSASKEELEFFVKNVIQKPEYKFSLVDCLNAALTSFRLPHLAPLRHPLEETCISFIRAPGTEGPEERANSDIELARAVFSVSQADAAAYFNEAIEAVSKFGDEMVERWEAVVSLARRATTTRKSLPELAYRFIRCGEMVGDTVAREKYWNRDDVFRTAVRLDAPGAFAALSRWADRNVGWFGDQLEALAIEAVKSGILDPVAGSCLSGFPGCNGSAEFAVACIRQAVKKSDRQRILNMAIRDCELAEAKSEDWITLEAVADEFHLDKGNISDIRSLSPSRYTPHSIATSTQLSQRDSEKIDWDKVFYGTNLLALDGVNQARTSLFKLRPQHYASPSEFWRELISRVPAGKESEFLSNAVVMDSMDIYDIENLIDTAKTTWASKAAVKKHWPTLLNTIGRRYARALVNDYYANNWRENHQLTPAEMTALQNAAFDGLSDTSDLVDANTFFGFVRQVSKGVTESEALDLLDYSITRFELHIPAEFGDGPWDQWLVPPSDPSEAMTGLIRAALGSPRSARRWEAAHCVRRLAENLCSREIDSLVASMKKGKVDSFGCQRFPFYEMHAKLYLLIAFARAGLDSSRMLKNHAKVFAGVALNGLPHVLIQKFAAEIALAIERDHPNTFSRNTKIKLRHVGKSPFRPKKIRGYKGGLVTPWHASGKVNKDIKLYFGYDFDRYWFEPLGRVFGVLGEQVEELARETAIRELKIPSGDEHVKDPRQEQWNSLDRYGSGGTWHDHGSSPRIDNYRFYYSYHALFIVAAKLLSTMPILQRIDYREDNDEWGGWLKWYVLHRSDGRWLSDRIDPPPQKRRPWTQEQNGSDWLWNVGPDDFFDCIANYNNLQQSLSVSGQWSDYSGDDVETVTVSSALVDIELSSSVANAMRTSDDSIGFGYMHHPENADHFNRAPFRLEQWICTDEDSGGRLDEFDPYAKQLPYPPDKVVASIASLLGISSDYERRQWRMTARKDPSLICEIWSNREIPIRADLDRPFRSGMRVTASVDILKKLCKQTGKNLIICVGIERRRQRSYQPPDEERLGYIPPSHKVFILSSNGILQDAQKSYQLR